MILDHCNTLYNIINDRPINLQVNNKAILHTLVW